MRTIFYKFQPKSSEVPLQAEVEMLESAVYLEDLTRSCFQSISELVHNGHVRRDCQLHSKEAMLSQNQLRKFLKEAQLSQDKIESMHRSHPMDPSHLSLLGVIEVALHSAWQKWNIYKYLMTHTAGLESTQTLGKAIERTWKEIKFLKNEEKFQKNKDSSCVPCDWPVTIGILT